ncbi:hypothetical protein LOAG_16815 [Loa loa]|uniref:Uncharacterized protein n=1 Tax=Loa loa TaxID=7209 RepID=A0A1S0UKF8_LOALO|nr:hypothetical protein LOAG_16815 [Loa loa]EJD76180.1 hypothetical protein LOAG_16815 [Loa loa]
MELVKIENNWKKHEQHKLNFYKCEYEPIWEKPEQMNYDLCSSHFGKGAQIWALQKTITNSTKCIHKIHMDLCSSHFGKGAQIWALQKTITNSTKCIHKIHMVPCHNWLLEGSGSKIYDNERAPPGSCGGLFGVPLPYEYITPETDIRAPQVTNEMLAKIYMNKSILSSVLHVKCPRCASMSSWYA